MLPHLLGMNIVIQFKVYCISSNTVRPVITDPPKCGQLRTVLQEFDRSEIIIIVAFRFPPSVTSFSEILLLLEDLIAYGVTEMSDFSCQ